MVRGRRREGGADPREEGGSDAKGRSAEKVGIGGTEEVVWAEGGSSSGRGIKTSISVPVPAKLGGGWGWHGEMQTGDGKAGSMGSRERIVIGGISKLG